jgi:hypothetical protein
MTTTHGWAAPTRTGWAGVAAGPLLALASGIELVVTVQRPDGTVTRPALFTGFITLWVLGILCVARTVREVRSGRPGSAQPLARAGRVGARFALTGALLQVAFGVLAGVTAAISGKPAEAVFVPYAVGFLCLVVGGVLLAMAVRRDPDRRPAAAPLLCGAVALFVSLTAAADPWHDIALFAFDASWVALGVVLIRGRRRPVSEVTARRDVAARR